MFRYLTAIFCLLGAVTVSAKTTNAGKAKKATTHANQLAPEISLPELKKLVDQKSVVLIDANSKESYTSGHIPGAVHFAANEENLGKVLPQDKSATIVAYCGGPMCTAWEDAAKAAYKLGYTNVKHLKAGIKGWKSAKYPTETSKES